MNHTLERGLYLSMTGEFKKILLPVDFSEYAEIAARRGVSLAKIYGATIYYLHVGDEARRSARKLSAFVKKIDADQQLSVKKLVAQGTPEKTILSVVRKIGADAIVMGTRGNSGLKHLVHGSVAEKVLRESDCPVLVIKKQKPIEFGGYVLPQIRHVGDVFQADKILVPLDFSPASKRALQYAVSIASRYNSTIYILTVFDKKFKEYGSDHQKHTSIMVHGEKIKLWQEFPELLRQIPYRLPQHQFKRLLVSGDPFTNIESLVEKKEIDLIIMGTNGRTGLEHFLLGSVAEKVLRSVACSVMTIRAQKTA
ncbi:MAG: universal stress protein [Candidatus Vecturithrix sp.]|jgi:nucleotide-binding universal stress UspA family protein|nr:universal stress protein [Candidatus Vecturithrix sp.]